MGLFFSKTSAFFSAINKNDLGKCQKIIQKDKSVLNLKDKKGLTGMHYSVLLDKSDITEFFCSMGADINTIDVEGNTPLHLAAKFNKNEMAEILIKNGAGINLKNSKGETPLHVAAEKGSMEVLLTLLNNKADVSLKTNAEHTALEYSIIFHPDPVIVELLCLFGSDVNVRSSQGITPLTWAIMGRGDFGTAKSLLERGASTDDDEARFMAYEYSDRHNNNRIFIEILDIYGMKSKIKDEYKVNSATLLEAAFKQFWAYMAVKWWNNEPRNEAICDYCNTSVKKNDGFLIQKRLACADCIDRLSKNMWENLASDPSYYGEGLLNKVNNYYLHN